MAEQITAPKTAEEAKAMQEALAAFQQKEADKIAKANEKLVAPLKAFVESDAFKEVEAKAAELVPQYRDHQSIDVHLSNIPKFMERVRRAADALGTQRRPGA